MAKAQLPMVARCVAGTKTSAAHAEHSRRCVIIRYSILKKVLEIRQRQINQDQWCKTKIRFSPAQNTTAKTRFFLVPNWSSHILSRQLDICKTKTKTRTTIYKTSCSHSMQDQICMILDTSLVLSNYCSSGHQH